MLIVFEFSGGYMNITAKYHTNTDELQEPLAAELEKLVETSGVFELKQTDIAVPSNGIPDIFSYILKLDSGGRRVSLTFNDVTIPNALQPLTSRLRELALQQTRELRMSQQRSTT